MISRRSVLLAIGTTLVAAPSAAAQTDMPARRWEHFYRQRAYPRAVIPAGALDAARAEVQRRWPRRRGGGGDGFPGLMAAGWMPLGPQQIPISMTSVGRMSAVAVHPADPNTIYVGAAQGGVWKSTDAGANWTPLTDNECSLAMGGIAIDPVDPNLVYAGTGEQHFSGDSYYGCGVLQSADGGATWTTLDQFSGGRPKISRVVIDAATAGSATTTTVYAASDWGLYRSTNSGSSWSQVLNEQATDLVVDPTDPTVLYAGTWGAVFKSVDNGVTWDSSGTGLPTSNVGRINLAIAPSNAQVLYASIHDASTQQLLGLYQTTNGGGAWTQLAATNASCGSQCWYDMALAVHPTDQNTVFFGGVSLFRSTDGGATFADVTGGIHVDQHFLLFDPHQANRLYVVNDGGIYKTDDATAGGITWTSLNTNLAVTQFYPGIALHPDDVTDVLGGTQDNGTLEYSGTTTWAQRISGDGGFTAIDPLLPTRRYGETQWSPGQGFSGPRRSDGGPFALKVNGINTSDQALFIPPLVMDPTDPQTLYFGTTTLYRTTDRGESWSVAGANLMGGSAISAIAPAPSDPDMIYVGASNGNLQVTTNGGSTWSAATTGVPSRYVTDLAVHPTSPDTAYVTVSGFGTGHVYRTENGGTSWQNVSGTLPDVPVNAILIKPDTPNTIYIGTDLGAFLTTDGAANWTAYNDGLPQVAVFDLALAPNTGHLVAATHGRGMFARTVSVALTMRVTPEFATDSVAVGATAPRPDSARVILSGSGAGSANWTATHGGGPWLTVTGGAGTGSGYARWQRDPTGLGEGVYVDTITVASTGLPDQRVIDTLVVGEALAIASDEAFRADTMLAGATQAVGDSVTVTLTGLGAGSAAWSVTHSAAAWLQLLTPSGTGPSEVRWQRNASALAAGVYVDTLVVTAAAAGSPITVIDTLVVAPAIALLDATDHLLLGASALSALQVATLDRVGNRDGDFNLGDFLAWVEWCTGAAPGGCIAPGPAVRRARSVAGLHDRRDEIEREDR